MIRPAHWLLFALAPLAACAVESSDQVAYLPSDATFIRSDTEACLVEHPIPNEGECCHALSFATDGTAHVEWVDEGFPGKYTLHGSHATGTIVGQTFTFDLETGVGAGGKVDGTWHADHDGLAFRVCYTHGF